MDKDKISAALAKTGFPLENYVSRRFSENSWTILSNRYYVDDVDGKARELDLIAYRVAVFDEVELVLGALISCKKDEENLWAFLTRDKPARDPNHDWNPINQWTNYDPLRPYLLSDVWKSGFYDKSGPNVRKVFSADRDVFARQQISKSKYTPQNDRAMFDASSGLMKAMAHELSIVQKRPIKDRIYIMFPVVVAEAEFVDVAYKEEAVSIKQIDGIAQYTNYIVGRKNVSAIVHFVRRETLSDFIGICNAAFKEAEAFLPKLIDESFSAIATNKDVRNYFFEKLKREIGFTLRWRGRRLGLNGDATFTDLSFVDGKLVIDIDCTSNELDQLKADEKLVSEIKKWLASKVRYRGPFMLDCGIPF